MKRLISHASSDKFVKYVATSPVVFREELFMDDIAEDISLLSDGDFEDLVDAVNESMDELGPSGLAEYIYDDNLKKIIKNINVTVTKKGAETYITATRELTSEEIDDLKSYITGQFSDGWGEGFEQAPISEWVEDVEYESYEDYDYEDDSFEDSFPERNALYVSFWNHKGFFMNIEKL